MEGEGPDANGRVGSSTEGMPWLQLTITCGTEEPESEGREI